MLRQRLKDKEFFYTEDSYESAISSEDMGPTEPLPDERHEESVQDKDILDDEWEELPF